MAYVSITPLNRSLAKVRRPRKRRQYIGMAAWRRVKAGILPSLDKFFAKLDKAKNKA